LKKNTAKECQAEDRRGTSLWIVAVAGDAMPCHANKLAISTLLLVPASLTSDDDDDVYAYSYDGMVVEEGGCWCGYKYDILQTGSSRQPAQSINKG
jgi:hypothetical protein